MGIADNKGWIIGITRKQVLLHGIIVSAGYGGDHIPGLVYSFIGEVLRVHSLKDSINDVEDQVDPIHKRSAKPGWSNRSFHQERVL